MLFLYTLYSAVGFYYLRSYVVACAESRTEPFNGNLIKQIFFYLLCGGFTTIILMLAVLISLLNLGYLVIKFFKDDEHKK